MKKFITFRGLKKIDVLVNSTSLRLTFRLQHFLNEREVIFIKASKTIIKRLRELRITIFLK